VCLTVRYVESYLFFLWDHDSDSGLRIFRILDSRSKSVSKKDYIYIKFQVISNQ